MLNVKKKHGKEIRIYKVSFQWGCDLQEATHALIEGPAVMYKWQWV